MKKRVFILVAYSLLLSLSVKAQQFKQFKFGDVKAEDFKCVTLETDSNANALMMLNLQDVSYRIVGNELVSVVENHKRIMILKDEGKEFANVSFTLYNNVHANVGHETLHGLKAVAINFENGKVVKTKMNGNMVFREKLENNRERVKFTIPKVKVGTIIEYVYTVQSDMYWSLDTWYAQNIIPVQYACYTAIIPEWLNFHYEVHGQKWMKNLPGDVLLNRKDMLQVNSEGHIWVGENIPAAKIDNYVYCPADYLAKVTAELASTSFPGSPQKDFGQTWPRIDEMLLSDKWFGGKIGSKSPFADELKAKGIDQISDEEERAAKTFELLISKVKWNKEISFATQSMAKTAKEGVGNNADINLLFINMLHDVGIKATPVAMRRRDLGMLPFTYPSLEKLNTFIVAIHLSDNKTLYADASSESGYFNAFSQNLQPIRARLINKEDGEKWVNLQEVTLATTSSTITATITANGDLEGDCKTIYRGQAAYSFRKNYNKAKDEKEYISSKAKSANIDISDYSATSSTGFGKESSEKYHFSRKGDATDSRIYINPAIDNVVTKNPFTDAERFLPIEFPFRQLANEVYSITIPDGWEVEELPQTINLVTPNKEMLARMSYSAEGNTIHIHTLFRMNNTFYTSEDYLGVKEMFRILADHSNDMIVLKKK